MVRRHARGVGAVPLLATVLLAGLCGALAAGCGADAPPRETLPAPPVDRSAGPPALAAVEAAPVEGFVGPGGQPFEVTIRTGNAAALLERPFGVRTFGIALRSAGLVQYPCTSCHEPGRAATTEGGPDAHGHIHPVHPAATGATCTTCHVPTQVDRLTLLSGETASLDHAYRLCAQCHFQQVEAWANGAHGKRLDGWQGRRVVLGCADCHDPHAPAVGRRVPFPGPTLPSSGEEAGHE